MRIFFCAVSVVLWSQFSLAQSKNAANKEDYGVRPETQPYLAKTEGSSFSIDPDLVDKVYKQSISSEVSSGPAMSASFEVALGELLPSELVIKNNYYEVPYDEKLGALPNVRLQMLVPVHQTTKSFLEAYISAGYANAQGVYEVRGANNIALKDSLSLDWVPVEGGVQYLFKPFSSSSFEIGPTAGIGADWLSQNGNLDGISQNFWLTHWSGGLMLSLFRDRSSVKGGFDGINLAAAQHSVTSKEQKFSGVNLLLSSRFSM